MEKEASQKAQKMSQTWYENTDELVKCACGIQNRTLQYSFNVFKDSVETTRGNLDMLQQWFRGSNKPQDQQEGMQSLMESGIEAWKRYLSSFEENISKGMEVLEKNFEDICDLTSKSLHKQQQTQEETWQRQQ
jgi:hypothetical protein